MSLANVRSRQFPWHRAIVAGTAKPTAGVPYGATLFEYVDGSNPPIGTYWQFTEAGWVPEGIPGLGPVYIHTITPTVVNPAAAQTDVVTIDGVACSFTSDANPTAAEIVTGLKAAIAASTAVGKFVASGTTTLILTPATSYSPMVSVSANLADVLTIGVPVMGSVDVASLPGTVAADIGTIKDDIALIKAQNLPPGAGSIELAFEAADTAKSQAIGVAGLLKGLHVRVPNFTNVVTATFTLTNAAGWVLWTSAAKAKNANYNLEVDVEWFEQVLMAPFLLVCTLSGAPGGAGGTVNLLPRYLGA